MTIAKEGAGRLYYRLGMTYAPRSLTLEASDHGFEVERFYEPADDPHDVTRSEDGSWIVRAGARVKVCITLRNKERRHHVALVDPMPAGFEAINFELSGAQPPPGNDDPPGSHRGSARLLGYSRWWWDHQNLRDECVEAFASFLSEGAYMYSYYARATTPGVFGVPPSKAEEMYSPETFGRGSSDRVIVR